MRLGEITREQILIGKGRGSQDWALGCIKIGRWRRTSSRVVRQEQQSVGTWRWIRDEAQRRRKWLIMLKEAKQHEAHWLPWQVCTWRSDVRTGLKWLWERMGGEEVHAVSSWGKCGGHWRRLLQRQEAPKETWQLNVTLYPGWNPRREKNNR